MSRQTCFALLLCGVLLLSGCQTAYFNALEQFGYHKREVLVDRVANARDAQEEAKEQFQSALEQFTAVLNFRGGELEKRYQRLNAEFQESEAKAEAVSDRIDAVQDVAGALFDEWEAELEQYNDDTLRSSSAVQLEQTRKRYSQLIRAMESAEEKIDPVLSAFRDQVLFLKHNLNAQAIASLQNELVSVEGNVAALIAEMEASIREADAFISDMAEP